MTASKADCKSTIADRTGGAGVLVCGDRSLDFSGNSLHGTLPATLSGLSQLVYVVAGVASVWCGDMLVWSS